MADFQDVMLEYVETAEEAARFVEWAKTPRGPVAVDTETTGLDRDARIRLIQFGDQDTAWTLRWDRWKGAALEGLEALRRGRARMVFHNAPYDVPKIERQSARDGDGHRFDWGLVEDTLAMSRLARPLGGHSLKALAAQLVDPRARAMQNVLGDAMSANGWTFETVPYDYVGYSTYAGIDCILTARLLPELEKLPFSRELYATEMAAMEACVAMSEAGMLVDQVYCADQIRQLEAEVADVVRAARDEFGIVALGSNQIVVDRLHDLGVFWDDRTEKGRVALDSDVLDRLSVEHPGCRLPGLVGAYRTKVKLMNTYFRNALLDSEEDGAVHPEINSIEAVTGRMSITRPAMQTLPRGPRVRRAYVARPGCYYMLGDYDQIEIRLLAHFCGDPGLTEAIETGDVHLTTARMIFKDDSIGRGDARRQLAKSSSLAIVYGAGDEKFSHTAGVTLEVGAAFIAEYDRTFPLVRQFQNAVKSTGKRRQRQEGAAYVVTPAGRKLCARRSDAEYTLVNYLFQGTAADVLKRAIQRLWTTDLAPYLRLPVHDELILEVPNDQDPAEVSKLFEETMRDDSFRVPLTVSTGGPYAGWGSKYDDPE